MTTVPLPAAVTDAIDLVPPSTSVSLVSTVTCGRGRVLEHRRAVVDRRRRVIDRGDRDPLVSDPLREVSSVTVKVTVRSAVDGASELLR